MSAKHSLLGIILDARNGPRRIKVKITLAAHGVSQVEIGGREARVADIGTGPGGRSTVSRLQVHLQVIGTIASLRVTADVLEALGRA